MIRDRGNIKWTAMMLPEHVAMLRELKLSEHKKSMPLIDEQQLEEMDETIRFAIDSQTPIKVTYYKESNYKSMIGTIKHYHAALSCIRVVNEGEGLTIYIKNIIDIKLEGE